MWMENWYLNSGNITSFDFHDKTKRQVDELCEHFIWFNNKLHTYIVLFIKKFMSDNNM